MALVPYVDPEEAGEQVRSVFAEETERYGRPTLFGRAMANDPELFAARAEYAAAVVEESGLEPELAELAYVAVSQVNDCSYCVASHAEHLVERVGLPDEQVEAVRRGDLEGFAEPDRTVIEVAAQVARDPKRVGGDHLDRLRDQGFDDGDVVAVVTVAAAAVAANAIADALNVLPQDREDPSFAAYAQRDDE